MNAINIRFFVLVTCMMISSYSLAQTRSHEEANTVTSIDGIDNGTFSGTYVHADGADAPHPWFAFCAVAGTTVSIEVDTTAWTDGSHIWFYDVLDNAAEVGDQRSVDFTTSIQENGFGALTYTGAFVAPADGQYLVQLDSWLGGDGDWTVTISGATPDNQLCGSGTALPEPPAVPAMSMYSMLILTFFVIISALVFRLRKTA